MDKRDAALQASMPTVMMPKFGSLEPSDKMGERLIVAQNGVFLEITRVWARFIRQVAPAICTPVPYGNCAEVTDWKIDPLPTHLLKAFHDQAAADCRNEVGASIIWNEASGYRLVAVEVLDSSASHLKFVRPTIGAGDHMVIDCHSHARGKAFFSRQFDDVDDAYCVKVSYVVGNCDCVEKSVAMRLCLKGQFENLTLEVQK